MPRAQVPAGSRKGRGMPRRLPKSPRHRRPKDEGNRDANSPQSSGILRTRRQRRLTRRAYCATTPAMPEFIFTMREVTKVHPPDKKVLEDITLAFFPGAKIGVIGANGSGKSSLLRIIAGVDT